MAEANEAVDPTDGSDKTSIDNTVSLQNVYDIYSSAIALLEELEKRETAKKGRPMLQTSDVKIPDQTEKDDDDIRQILQVQFLALKYQLKCIHKSERERLCARLRRISYDWLIPRQEMKFKSEIYVNNLLDILHNRRFSIKKTDDNTSELHYAEDLERLFISKEKIERPVEDGKPGLPQIRTMICEKEPKPFPVPKYWTSMHDELSGNFDLKQESDEWNDVSQRLHKSLGGIKINQIKRLQNLYIWEVFYLTKRNFERKYGKGNDNELFLFHGTTPDLVEIIVKHNLDPRLAGKNASLLGKGTYFAVNAKYSHDYAEKDDNGHRYLFLARVLTGTRCQGNHTYNRPPLVNPNNPRGATFDSCVDKVNCPSIYCIFHNSQFYVEYLIKYM